MNKTLLSLVRTLADGQVHSGQSLGASLGVSRAAVSKSLRTLPELGVPLNQQAGRGYWLDQPLQLLDEAAIRTALGDEGSRCLLDLKICPSTPSTNNTLRATPAPALPNFAALLAEHQSAGRGRQGKSWAAPFAGGVLLSVAQQVAGGIGRVAGLSLVVGMAVRRALLETGIKGIKLKWPNDVFFLDRKLAGVLIEVDGDVGGSCQWVAGVGLNWRFSGAVVVDQPWIDLAEICGSSLPARNHLAGRLLHHVMAAADQLTTFGLSGFLDEWRAADALAGKLVSVTLPGAEPLQGEAAGIDDSGALLLATATGLRPVVAGTLRVLA